MTTPYVIYPVDVVASTDNKTTIKIVCDNFTPTTEEEWQIDAAAAWISSSTARTHAFLLGAGHHVSTYTPNEAEHLTLKPYDENHEKLRSDFTGHVYISAATTPWLGEWYKSAGAKTHAAFLGPFEGAEVKPSRTLDLTAPGVTWAFHRLDSKKPIETSPLD